MLTLGPAGCADDTAARLDALERRLDRLETALAARGVALDARREAREAPAAGASPTSSLEQLGIRLDAHERARIEERVRVYADRLRARYGEPGSPERQEAIVREVIRRYRERRAAAEPTPTGALAR